MPRLVLRPPRRARLQDVAIAITPRYSVGVDANTRQISFDHIDQTVHRRTVVARSLDLDPASDAGKDLLPVEGRKVGPGSVSHDGASVNHL